MEQGDDREDHQLVSAFLPSVVGVGSMLNAVDVRRHRGGVDQQRERREGRRQFHAVSFPARNESQPRHGPALFVRATQILRAISKAVALGCEGSGRERPIGPVVGLPLDPQPWYYRSE